MVGEQYYISYREQFFLASAQRLTASMVGELLQTKVPSVIVPSAQRLTASMVGERW